LVAVALLFAAPMLIHLILARTPPTAAPAAPGTFRPTSEQWATLRIATVQSAEFPSTIDTDGKIVTDDERTTAVYSPYSGQVTRVYANLGDTVKKGSPLFAILASEFAQAQSDLAAALAQLKLAQANEARLHELFKESGAAQKDWQQSGADLATAKSGVEAVRNRLRIMGIGEPQLRSLERQTSARGIDPRTVVAAPIGGVIVQKAVSVGQNLLSLAGNGGSTPAFTVSDLRNVWLVGALREVDSPRARVGQRIEAHVVALPGRVFEGRVDFVAPTVDPNTQRVLVRARIANPDGLLKPEMIATVRLFGGGSLSGVAVPEAAVIYEGDTARVWVARPDRTLELRRVKTGETLDGVVAVTAGLRAGERVVTSGSLFIDRAAQGD
jgi:cobalt-zinc-cadmium efflux system membrane fusion protein